MTDVMMVKAAPVECVLTPIVVGTDDAMEPGSLSCFVRLSVC